MPGRIPDRCQIEFQKECQSQNICQIKHPIESQSTFQIECQNICVRVYVRLNARKDARKNVRIEVQVADRLSGRMPDTDRMPNRKSEDMPDRKYARTLGNWPHEVTKLYCSVFLWWFTSILPLGCTNFLGRTQIGN